MKDNDLYLPVELIESTGPTKVVGLIPQELEDMVSNYYRETNHYLSMSSLSGLFKGLVFREGKFTPGPKYHSLCLRIIVL